MSASTIRCPHCGTEAALEVPENACVYFWDCPSCRTIVKPRAGDCCVVCSYGSAPCPSRANTILRGPWPALYG